MASRSSSVASRISGAAVTKTSSRHVRHDGVGLGAARRGWALALRRSRDPGRPSSSSRTSTASIPPRKNFRNLPGETGLVCYPTVSSLRAPVAVSIEIRAPGDPERRVFRLAAAIGEDGARLERPAPFEIGRPVAVRFFLPDAREPLALRAEIALADGDGEGEHGGREVTFLDPSTEARRELRGYVAERLGLPPAP
jgi:hypothetical protein